MAETTPPDENGDDRGPARQFSAEAAVRAVHRYREQTGSPVATATDLAGMDSVQVTRPTVSEYLKEAEERGLLESRQVSQAIAYYPPPDADESELADELKTGGGQDATLAVREAITDAEGEIYRIFREVIEDAERERTQQQSDDTADTWGERATGAAEYLAGVFILFSSAIVVEFLAFIVLTVGGTGVLEASVPVLGGTVREGVLLMLGLMLMVCVVSLFGALGFAAAAALGIPDAAERFTHRILGGDTPPPAGERDGEAVEA